MLRLKADGHHVISLSQAEGNEINSFLISQGIEVYSKVVNSKIVLWTLFLQLYHFISFCYIHKVSVVFSHLDTANFTASIGQYFIRSKVFLCRHHVDEAELY